MTGFPISKGFIIFCTTGIKRPTDRGRTRPENAEGKRLVDNKKTRLADKKGKELANEKQTRLTDIEKLVDIKMSAEVKDLIVICYI